ncbi:MAG: RsmB/NOP family class I SAM-dependent RNA methyltransferase [Candidatus Devosia phytovorans]|uniref:RsmB/NOP family class I SAM-dependent RNA methyltransferase n=1 Tax=Candidatus Devosia phytovorans TaxID=3121372 RepID=A0AAJ6AZV7_9HYPH|nr:RsmB/NOP family class I SAM-dependent RNA methyltransferase [Devosia sp.]WEK04221.1 MAG: RsmB/NOP family class I SAM-dependent RNA methyltransferase [Devosia sp.]
MAHNKPDPAGLKLRLVAAQRLKDVLAGDNFVPLNAKDLADGRDRALANRLITTALRRQGQLNFIIHALLEKGMPGKSGTFEAVLRLSLAQLVFLPDLGAHSALFLAVEAVKRDPKARHLSGLINAVLRSAQANSAKFGMLDDDLLIPETFGDTWLQAYGEEGIDGFSTALLAGAPLDLTLKHDDAELIEALGAEKLIGDTVRIDQRDRPVEALPGYDDGKWWVQDAASAIPARLLGAKAGGRVLDLCAAPGGKTAQLIKSGYAVTALDSDATRMERLKDNLKRLDYSAEIIVGDAGTFAPNSPYDGVLLDAPCSATGTFRRHPEVIWHRSVNDVAGRVRLQKALLTNAFRCLDAGGALIYCVCSLEPAEGEEQVDWALDSLPGLELWPVTHEELPGLEQAVTAKGLVRTHPGMAPNGHEGGMDGFFVARFRRRA